MSTATNLPAHDDLDDIPLDRYLRLLARLSHLSVTHHFDAYGDIDWDEPEFAIDAADPRWELPADDALGATTWYRELPAAQRARIGLDRSASVMKIGLDFERILKRGLLEFTDTLPNGALEFRYAYHEVIEEAQHSLRFREFVNRSGFNPTGLRRFERWAARPLPAQDQAAFLATLRTAEYEQFTDAEGFDPSDPGPATNVSPEPFEVTSVTVKGDVAQVEFQRPASGHSGSLYLRKESRAWKMCTPAEEQFNR